MSGGFMRSPARLADQPLTVRTARSLLAQGQAARPAQAIDQPLWPWPWPQPIAGQGSAARAMALFDSNRASAPSPLAGPLRERRLPITPPEPGAFACQAISGALRSLAEPIGEAAA